MIEGEEEYRNYDGEILLKEIGRSSQTHIIASLHAFCYCDDIINNLHWQYLLSV